MNKQPLVIGDTPESLQIAVSIDGKVYTRDDIKRLESELQEANDEILELKEAVTYELSHRDSLKIENENLKKAIRNHEQK